MMATAIDLADGEEMGGVKENGLVKGHLYSITKVCQAQTDLGNSNF